MCSGGMHVSPKKGDFKRLQSGNPPPGGYFPWKDYNCPLAFTEFVAQSPLARNKAYPKLNQSGTGFIKSNEGDVVERAIDWFVDQGVCDPAARYCTNSGRKALGRLCDEYGIPYHDSFQVHADRQTVWQGSYQPNCQNSNFESRSQHTSPDVVCKALRTVATRWGVGCQKPPPLTREERYRHHCLALEKPKLAEKIRKGLPTDSEDEEDELEVWTPEPEPAPPAPARLATAVPRAVPGPPKKRRRRHRTADQKDKDWMPRKAAKELLAIAKSCM